MSLLVQFLQFLESLNMYSLLGPTVACYAYFIVAVVNLSCSNLFLVSLIQAAQTGRVSCLPAVQC